MSSSTTEPAAPAAPKEWTRPADFDARMARVQASLPSDPAAYATMSREEQIADFEARIAAVRREFPDMPVTDNSTAAGAGGEGKEKWYVEVVDFGRLVKTLDEETTAKFNAATERMYASLFDEKVVEEVQAEMEGLLKERYPEVWKATETSVFGKREAWGKMREFAKKEMAAGRGNPLLKGYAAGASGKAEVKGGE